MTIARGGKLKRPIWPLMAPGMPLPGPNLLAIARMRGSQAELAGKKSAQRLSGVDYALAQVIGEALYSPRSVAVNLQVGSGKVASPIVCGHRWGAGISSTNGLYNTQPSPGPEPCRVMVVGKSLTGAELESRRHFEDAEAWSLLVDTLRKFDYTSETEWYVTSALKTLIPDVKGAVKPGWLAEFTHLFHQELRLVRPDFILCVGADALKLVLGKQATLDKVRGSVKSITIDVRRSYREPAAEHTIQVMACEHPRAVYREDKKRPRFELDVKRFVKLISGLQPDQVETDLQHHVVSDELTLRKIIATANENNPTKLVAVDAEWHKQHPQNEGAYLRCVQFSWAHKAAACVVLNAAGGKPAFRRLVRDVSGRPLRRQGKLQWSTLGGTQVAIDLLREYFVDKRVIGHFLNADLEWLVYYGLDLRPQFKAAPRWQDCKKMGGFDTAFAAHAVEETGIFNLTDQHLRLTDAPRYDLALEEWKAKFCRENKLKASQLEGYGECPGEILYPYALLDADVTRRLAVKYFKWLDKDAYGNNCWKAFWLTQRAAPAALEITCTGLRVNRDRLDRLTTVYMQARDSLAAKIRAWSRWPTLNLRATQDLSELLFGEKYNTPGPDGKVKRARPRGALSLHAMPTLTTDKRPKAWDTIVGTPAEKTSRPSVNKSALAILLRESNRMQVYSHKQQKYIYKDCGSYIADIRNYRVVNQTLQSVLAPPVEDSEADVFEDPYETDDDDNYVYESRLPGAICTDNRIRTFISPLKETGRWSSYRPPLMNLGKRREADYKQILGDSYEFPIRSIFEADEGYTLVEADYIGAELFGMAILSGDETMIEHALRNQLPEDHPNYFDIHSYIAKLAFQLDCEPTKVGLKKIDKGHLRIVAKSVIFGVAYGRGAKAVALAVREEGVLISIDAAQAVIDTIFTTYPKLVPFFETCRSRACSRDPRVVSPRFLCGVFGRYRRFPFTTDRELLSDFERQAMNFPLQNMVADAVGTAVFNLMEYREERKLGFKIALQIHDALLFLVPNAEVPMFVDEVLPTCMVKRVPIYPRNLDGTARPGVKAYNLGIDCEIYRYWGEGMSPRDCQDRQIPEKYAGWHASELFAGGWETHKSPGSVWLPSTERSHAYLVGPKTKQPILKEVAYRQAVALGKLPASDLPDGKAAKAVKDSLLCELLEL